MTNIIYCGNNEFASELRRNGGRAELGTHSACFKKGYGTGFHPKVLNVPKFVKRWGGKYQPLIKQQLWHSDTEPVPQGYQLATRSQTMQRGFAFGSIALARQLASQLATSSRMSSPTRPLPIQKRSWQRIEQKTISRFL